LDNEIREAFHKGESLPEDKYFKKIWNSIECKAPVGEKYYLRSFFLIFFFLAVIVFFVLFYTEFFATVVTLREIRKENAKFFKTFPSTLLSPTQGIKSFKTEEIAKGIIVTSKEDSRIVVESNTPEAFTLGVYQGHFIVEKKDDSRALIILLPDLSLTILQGRCNIFCYDDIIRIIPLTHPLEIEHKNKKNEILPGSMLYLLDKTKMVILPGNKKI